MKIMISNGLVGKDDPKAYETLGVDACDNILLILDALEAAEAERDVLAENNT